MKNVIKRMSDGLDYISSGLRGVLGSSGNGAEVDRFSIEGKWFAAHMKEFSWAALLGAEIITDDEKLLEVCGIQERSWPDGPILEVKFITGVARGNAFYNHVGFTSGKFRIIYPLPEQAAGLKEVYSAALRLDEVRKAQERLKHQLLEQQRKEEEIRIKEQNKLRQKEAELLNASRKFDLILFDLDDTLLQSGHLDKYRGRDNLNNGSNLYKSKLKIEASKLRYLIAANDIASIRLKYPSLKIGVFTRAPRNYAFTLLDICYPSVQWDCIVAYEDVDGRTKPFPNGVFYAAKKVGIDDLSRVVVVGDESSDLIASYQAGALAVLFVKGWGEDWNSRDNPKRRDHYFSRDLIPDARISKFSDLENIISSPERYYPALEAWPHIDMSERFFPLRVDTRNHFNNSLSEGSHPSWVVTNALGRYFPNGSDHRYDFSRRERDHETSKAILRAKDGYPYPDEWVDCCKAYIEYVANDFMSIGYDVVVTTIPSSGKGPGANRLEQFIERVSSKMNNGNILFDFNAIRFKSGVQSNKTLNQVGRFMNIESHMEVSSDFEVDGKVIIVLDDVVTSGATLYYADRFLKDSGAYKVICVALTQTVS